MPGEIINFKKEVQNRRTKMKKFWIALLAVGLFMAFTMPAIAAVGGADVQFSGTLRERGWYDDNVSLLKNTLGGLGQNSTTRGQAFYDNRLRLETTFKVAEGLKLVTRFDALEQKWGQSGYGTAGTASNSNNISFERAYVSFTTGLGTLNVGYQDWSRFGTQFIDSDESFPGIKYINSFGPLTVLAGTEKRSESRTATGNFGYDSGKMDVDSDMYLLGGIFKFKGGEAGLLWEWLNDRSHSESPNQTAPGNSPYRISAHIFDAYGKFKAGPVYVEAEGFWMTGGMMLDYTKLAATKNSSLEAYGIYINAEVDLKPLYVGGKYVYTTGDDPATTDKKEGSMNQTLGLGTDHDFALMLGNYEYFNQVTANGVAGGTGWVPNAAATGGAANVNRNVGYGMDNLIAWQLYVGVKPSPKLDIRLALTDAFCQIKPYSAGQTSEWISNHIGTEVDLRASYKIFDNLTYSIGAGYFFTGDYFKGYSDSLEVSNDYLLMHQLLLSF